MIGRRVVVVPRQQVGKIRDPYSEEGEQREKEKRTFAVEVNGFALAVTHWELGCGLPVSAMLMVFGSVETLDR